MDEQDDHIIMGNGLKPKKCKDDKQVSSAVYIHSRKFAKI